MLHGKSQLINALKLVINEFERQLDRKVKIIRSNKGGEYYGRYNELWQNCSLFAKFLEKRDMCSIHNVWYAAIKLCYKNIYCIMMDMVRSIISNSSLLLLLWMYVLKTMIYL